MFQIESGASTIKRPATAFSQPETSPRVLIEGVNADGSVFPDPTAIANGGKMRLDFIDNARFYPFSR